MKHKAEGPRHGVGESLHQVTGRGGVGRGMGSFSSRGRRVAEPTAGREEATRAQHPPAHGHRAAMQGDGIEEDAGRCKAGMQQQAM